MIMKDNLITDTQLEKLIPVFTEAEKQNLIAYNTVYKKYAEAFSEKALHELKTHPVWAPILSQMTKEVMDEQNKISYQIQDDAIFHGKWLPYIHHTTQQGIQYAQMGIDFKAWFDIIALVRKYFIPIIQKEYNQSEKMIDVIHGLDLFMDLAMTIIGESYIQETRKIIEIQKLAALEQKQMAEKELMRIEELERFRKLTVGRELKMIELKVEIEELKIKISFLEKTVNTK